MAELVRVQTKSAWLSKINWISALGIVSGAIGTAVANNILGLDPDVALKVLSVWTMVQSVGTMVVKTWFTPTVTPASASLSGQKTLTLD